MKKLAVSTLFKIAGVSAILIVVVILVAGLLAFAAVFLTVLLCCSLAELSQRSIDDVHPEKEPSSRPASKTALLMAPDRSPSTDRTTGGRSSPRVVNSWFQLHDQGEAQGGLPLAPAVPRVSSDHQDLVAEYFQVGLALGRALEDVVSDDKLIVNPGLVSRFERVEAKFAHHYRTLTPVDFRKMSTGEIAISTESAHLVVPLSEGEVAPLYGPTLMQRFVKTARKTVG